MLKTLSTLNKDYLEWYGLDLEHTYVHVPYRYVVLKGLNQITMS